MNVWKIASTTAKLLKQDMLIRLAGREKKLIPVTIHLSPTDKCNLKCEFCSVKARGMSFISGKR